MPKEINKDSKEIKASIMTTRHCVRVVAFVVFGLSLGAYLILQVYPYLEVKQIVVDTEQNVEANPIATETPYALTREMPVRLRVPKMSIDTTFEAPLGLNEDGTISVPSSYEKVGWYKLGAAPGEIGTASILGHVDSRVGPAIFFSLGQLAPGDRIFVSRADGSEAEFEVQYLERYKQDEFPTEKVYSPTKYSSLRLITCSGVFSKGEQRYSHNLVVFARLLAPEVKN